jgi:hypothetical protein
VIETTIIDSWVISGSFSNPHYTVSYITETLNEMRTLRKMNKRQTIEEFFSMSIASASVESVFSDSLAVSTPAIVSGSYISTASGITFSFTVASQILASESSASSELAEAAILDTGILPVNVTSLPQLQSASQTIPAFIETPPLGELNLPLLSGGSMTYDIPMTSQESDILTDLLPQPPLTIISPPSMTPPPFTQKLFVGLNVVSSKSNYEDLGQALREAS